MTIKIGKPYLKNENGKTRLLSDINAENDKFTLWYEVEEKYEPYLMVERCDSFAIVLLPWAMMKAKKSKIKVNIVSDTCISAKLWHQLTDYYIPILSDSISYYNSINVDIKTAPNTIPIGKGCASSISGGLDSFYTIHKYKDYPVDEFRLTHVFYCDYGFYGDGIGSNNEDTNTAKLRKVADAVNLEFIKFSSNVVQTLYQKGHGPIVPAVLTSTILSLQKLISVFHYSSAEGSRDFSMDEEQACCYDLLNMYCFSTENTSFYLSGMDVMRLDKAAFVADIPIVQENLLVCETQVDSKNCSICANCTHTMAEFSVLGKLDSFSKVFDIARFKKNPGYYWGYMLLKSRGSGLYIRELKEIVRVYKQNNGSFPLGVHWAAFTKWVKRGFTTANKARRRVEDEIR